MGFQVHSSPRLIAALNGWWGSHQARWQTAVSGLLFDSNYFNSRHGPVRLMQLVRTEENIIITPVPALGYQSEVKCLDLSQSAGEILTFLSLGHWKSLSGGHKATTKESPQSQRIKWWHVIHHTSHNITSCPQDCRLEWISIEIHWELQDVGSLLTGDDHSSRLASTDWDERQQHAGPSLLSRLADTSLLGLEFTEFYCLQMFWGDRFRSQ